MELSKAQRRALPDDAFAVPAKRVLPIQDEVHLRMAWKMVDGTSLSAAERSEARVRILAKAEELGVDTDDWRTIKAMSVSIEAMSLQMPMVEDHPNRVPFSGVLTKLDEPSDRAPGGSGGRCVIMTSASAQAALPSLLGMAVDFTAALDGHDTKSKIGVITGADIVGNEVRIEGFFYAADFPTEVQRIQAAKSVLGWSYEIQRVRIVDPSADPLEIESFVFTGAAVLQKSKAAYQTTSLTASAEKDEIMDETLKALLASVAALTAKVDSLSASAQASADEKAAAEKAAADKVEAEKTAAIAAAAKTAENATVATLQASVAELTKQISTMVADQNAAKIAAAAGPERKTLPAHVTALLAKAGVTPEGDAKMNVADLDKAFQAAGVSSQNSMATKMAMQRAGLL